MYIYIDKKLQELSKIFLQSARQTEDNLHKKYNKKKALHGLVNKKKFMKNSGSGILYKSTSCDRA